MDRHDDKWVDLMRDKLDNYSPSYNAADWSSLAGKMSAAGTGGHGWLLSKLLPYTKIILISSVAVITTVVTLHYYLNEQTTDNKLPVTQQQDTSSVILPEKDMAEHTEAVATKGLTADEINTAMQSEDEKGQIETNSNNENSVVKTPEAENSVSERDTESEKSPALNTEAAYQKQAETQASQETSTIQESKKQDQTVTGKQPTTASTGNIDSEQKTIDNYQNNLSLPVEETGMAALSQKLKSRRFENNMPVRVKSHSLPRHRGSKTSSDKNKIKQKPVKQEKPFYIGISYSGNYVNDNLWYHKKYQSLFGISMEKYIFGNFSASFNPRVSLNSIYKKYAGTTLHEDSIYVALDDSLGIPVPPDSSETYPGKLSYIDMPVIFSYDVFSGIKYKLSASLGITSRYTFSLQKDELSEEMKGVNNRFSFFQAGWFSLRYNRAVSDKIFFEIEPYWQFPLKKGSGSFDRSFYGLNLYIKFRAF